MTTTQHEIGIATEINRQFMALGPREIKAAGRTFKLAPDHTLRDGAALLVRFRARKAAGSFMAPTVQVRIELNEALDLYDLTIERFEGFDVVERREVPNATFEVFGNLAGILN